MQTNGVSGTQSSAGNVFTNSTGVMDQDAFLKLLITELRHQDPMSPMQDKDFIAQLAQFSSLEQMKQMSQGFEVFGESATASQAFGMAGKWIDYLDPNDPTFIRTGKVSSVTFEYGQPMLNVNGEFVSLNNVMRVFSDFDSVGCSRTSIEAFNLIGKDVEFFDEESGKAVIGKVDSVSLINGWPKLNIGGKSIDITNVLRENAGSSVDLNEMLNQAVAMVGRKVDYTSGNSVLSGTVTQVSFADNIPWLQIGDSLVDVANVVKVY